MSTAEGSGIAVPSTRIRAVKISPEGSLTIIP